MLLPQCFFLCRRPNPFRHIMHHRIDQLIVNCRPLCQSVWKNKVETKVLGTHLIQDMAASRKIGIFIPLLLRDTQIIFILGSFRTKRTEEALRSIQDTILSLGRYKSWQVALNVPGEVMATSASRYPSTRHDVFKDQIELFQGMKFLPGCHNMNRH